MECDEEIIGESARTFWEGLKEHLMATFPIYDHVYTSGHHTKLDNFSIVGRESHTIARTIKEAIYIRVNDVSLNRNNGKYQLPHIWDDVLFNTLTSTSNGPSLPFQKGPAYKVHYTSPRGSAGRLHSVYNLYN